MGFGDSERMAIYFQGFGEKGLFIFRDLWRKHNFWRFREQGAEEKHFRELGRKVIFFQGAGSKDPPVGGGV